ncbi:unnamed protein product [marine sediment metagenome]|uniref:Uncharacterized protein n=1 Tax=marine sediment metagenome TaxID=412755 RepID=X1H7Z6_9ZZZZ
MAGIVGYGVRQSTDALLLYQGRDHCPAWIAYLAGKITLP